MASVYAPVGGYNSTPSIASLQAQLSALAAANPQAAASLFANQALGKPSQPQQNQETQDLGFNTDWLRDKEVDPKKEKAEAAAKAAAEGYPDFIRDPEPEPKAEGADDGDEGDD